MLPQFSGLNVDIKIIDVSNLPEIKIDEAAALKVIDGAELDTRAKVIPVSHFLINLISIGI